MKQLLLPSLTTLAVLMMMPVSASAGPAVPMSAVFEELVGPKTTLIQADMRSNTQRIRRANPGARRTARRPSSRLSRGTSQPTNGLNPGVVQALTVLVDWCYSKDLPPVTPCTN